MIKSAIIETIKNRLGQRTDLDTFITTELDLQQETALQRNGRIVPWFLESEVYTHSTTASDEKLALPTGFVAEKEDGGLFLYQSGEDEPYTKLIKCDYDDAVLEYGDTVGVPKVYSLSGIYIRVRPIPDAVYSLKQIYFLEDTLPSVVALGSYNNWMRYAPDVMIAQLCVQLATFYIQDFNLAALQEKALTAAWDRIFVETEAQKHNARYYQMG